MAVTAIMQIADAFLSRLKLRKTLLISCKCKNKRPRKTAEWGIVMTLLRDSELQLLLDQFDLKGTCISFEKFGDGHINDTFLLKLEQNGIIKKYILQTINPNVFQNIRSIMENIACVTAHLKKKALPGEKVMTFLQAKDGNTYFVDEDGGFWRIYEFIDSICLQLPESDHDFYECGFAFGKFQRDLDDFPADSLHEIIPDFHNTPKRYQTFLNAVRQDICGRAASVQEEIDFIRERSMFYSVLENAYQCGKLPIRVSHNDTKCNNVLLDNQTRKALCVIDLDTIMPGFSVNDFGDAIRFGASTAAEDEQDLNQVCFDINKFKVFTKGFLDGCGGLLNNAEILLLPEGAKMMTAECGMRFLTDYLQGDHYFKTDRPHQNLDRCRTQLKLVRDMEEHWQEMKAFVSAFCAK